MNISNEISNFTSNEMAIISKLSFYNKEIISFNEFQKYMPSDYKYTLQFIYKLKKKKVLTPIKKGVYSFNPIWAQPVTLINVLKIGNVFFSNCKYYIGYSSAFNSYQLTEQVPVVTCYLNTKISAKKEINGQRFKFKKLKDEFFYGIKDVEVKGEIVKVSDFERTIIDFVDKWNFKEARQRVIEKIKDNKCDINKLIEYSIRFPKIVYT
jgi:predicted transcriptional regulator of viral defense system